MLDWAVDGQAREGNGASIFTALEEQLRLRLERAKGRVQIAIVDHIERPSRN